MGDLRKKTQTFYNPFNGLVTFAYWVESDKTDFGLGTKTYDSYTNLHSVVISGVVVVV